MKELKGSIYLGRCYTTGRFYVGQTTLDPPEERISGHKQAPTNSLFHQTIREHGIENIMFCWLRYKDVEIEELDTLEVHYIRLFNTMTPNGFNQREGKRLTEQGREQLRKKYPYNYNYNHVILNGNQMRDWRIDQKITLKNLSNILECDVSSIIAWEKERYGIGPKLRQRWFIIFGFDPVDKFN